MARTGSEWIIFLSEKRPEPGPDSAEQCGLVCGPV
jgi:hypothetical protein